MGERQQSIALAQEALEIFEQIEPPHADKVRRQLDAWRRES
jgi:hypothetical protein